MGRQIARTFMELLPLDERDLQYERALLSAHCKNRRHVSVPRQAATSSIPRLPANFRVEFRLAHARLTGFQFQDASCVDALPRSSWKKKTTYSNPKMNMKYSLSVCLVALLCLAWSDGLRAADDYQKAPGHRSAMGTPAKANKATGLIGMDVRNQNDERLGTIKDLVVDLQTGKVSYAVLDGGGVFKDKLFAVPISAFTASADQRHLILNADKSKMEAAKGFDKDSWPSVSNPEWGAEAFWQPRAGTAPSRPEIKPDEKK